MTDSWTADDEIILGALRMFGPLNPIQIAEKIQLREDLKQYHKDDLDKFTVQSRLETMLRSGKVKRADGYEEEKRATGFYTYRL